jgi:hypothetical protein
VHNLGAPPTIIHFQELKCTEKFKIETLSHLLFKYQLWSNHFGESVKTHFTRPSGPDWPP